MTKFEENGEKWIIGSAWPYAHAIPHLGNLLCLLAADAYARFYRLQGEKVVMVSGSDQHGARMEFEAAKKGISPKELVDLNHQKIVKYLQHFKIDFERFGNYTRTESEQHKEFIKDIYMEIYGQGYLFARKETLPYCPNCEKFLPDRFIEGTCPHCGHGKAQGNQCDNCLNILDPKDLIEPSCAFCGSEPIFKESKNWYLDLPKLADQLEEYVNEQEQWPERVKNLTLSWIEEGLEPRAITRDVEFGIQAPFADEEGKTIYVWAEAVLGYISATKEWANREEERNFDAFWKDPDTKLLFTLGKDNIPFHSVIFPALVMASGREYVLPFQIFANEFLNFEGKQFSKTERRGIWLDEAVELFENPDYWRYYLFSIFPEQKDTDFRWNELEARINDELIANFANFIYRSLSFLYENFDGKLPEGSSQEVGEEILEQTQQMVQKEQKLIEEFKLREGLKKAIELARRGNKFLTNQEPWHTIDSKPEKCARTLYVSLNLCKILAVLIEPYLPLTAEKIWDQLNMDSSVHDVDWGTATEFSLEAGHVIKEPDLLFEKVQKEELKSELKKIREQRET